MGRSNFHLNKWFLDFVAENGEAFIFYAAKLSWKSFSVQYASCIHYQPNQDLKITSHYRNVSFPNIKGNLIKWHDKKFKVSGSWESKAKPVSARIFEDHIGYLDWKCLQPASQVCLKLNDTILNGKGYVEQLILTTPPWNISMDDLRWGRFHSNLNTIVWIELRKVKKQQWLWLNGEKIADATIEDDQLVANEKYFVLNLDRNVVLESSKKIFEVVGQLLKYLPGFNKSMTSKFLLAENKKWLSNGELTVNGNPSEDGIAIHEWVNFNTVSN